MSTTTGLLLINANGDMYFIEQGIRALKLGEGTTFGNVDPNDPDIRAITDVRIKDSEIEKFEVSSRKALAFEPRSYPGAQPRDPKENLGPMVFQGFNVMVTMSSAGESEITGNGTAVEAD